MCWQSSFSEPAHQALRASLTIYKAGRAICNQKCWFQIKRGRQVVLLLFDLRLSYKEELKISNNHKPFSGHWTMWQQYLIRKQVLPSSRCVSEVTDTSWAEAHSSFYCSRPQVHSLIFGLTLTFWSQWLLLERLWPVSVNIFLEVVDPQKKECFTWYFLFL